MVSDRVVFSDVVRLIRSVSFSGTWLHAICKSNNTMIAPNFGMQKCFISKIEEKDSMTWKEYKIIEWKNGRFEGILSAV